MWWIGSADSQQEKTYTELILFPGGGGYELFLFPLYIEGESVLGLRGGEQEEVVVGQYVEATVGNDKAGGRQCSYYLRL